MKKALAGILLLILAGSIFAEEAEELDIPGSEEAFFLMEQNIVTASRREQMLFEVPGTVYTVDEDDFRRYGYRELKDLLKSIPSVEIVDFQFWLNGGQRGYSGNFAKTLLMKNGRELQSVFTSETFISRQFGLNDVNKVEIIQGPASALYGANAFTGVINILTKTQDPDYEGAEVNLEYGSFNSWQADMVFAKQLNNHFRLAFSTRAYISDEADMSELISDTSIYGPSTDPPIGAELIITNIVNNVTNIYTNRNDYQNDSKVYNIAVHLNYLDFYGGVDYSSKQSGNGIENPKWWWNSGIDEREMLLSYLGYRNQFLNDKLDIKVEYLDYFENIYTVGTTYDGVMRTWIVEGSRKHRLETQCELDMPKVENILIAGGDFEIWDLGVPVQSFNQIYPSTNYTYLNQDQLNKLDFIKGALFVQDQQILFDKLYLTTGMRLDYHSYYQWIFTARGGLAYRMMDQTVIKCLVGNAFREPSLFEVASTSPDLPILQPERILTSELSWMQNIGQYLLNQVTGYYNYATDVIIDQGEFTPPYRQIVNQGEKKVWGIEDSLNFQLGGLEIDITYSYTFAGQSTNTLYVDAGGGLTNTNTYILNNMDMPYHRLNVGVSYLLFEHLSFGVMAHIVGDVETWAPLDKADPVKYLSPFADISLTVSLVDWDWGDDFSLNSTLTIDNLLNTPNYQPNARDKSTLMYPQAPFRVFWKIGVAF